MTSLRGAVPTDIQISNNSLAENDVLFYYIGTLTTVDADSVDTFTYSLDGLSVPVADNDYFRIRNDSLFSFYSFNYEKQNAYTIRVKTTDSDANFFEKTLTINITDLTGKYDKNGIADQDIANKYPSVNVGDFVFLHPNTNNENLFYGGGFSAVSSPNKVLIRGDRYETIFLNLKNVSGSSTDDRVIITNFLGQVHTRKFGCTNGVNWRLTGEYDANKQTGSPYYLGCKQNGDAANYQFSAGTYGIWIQNEWQSIDALLLYVYDFATGFEIDHIETSDGAFSGVFIKDEKGSQNMDSVYIHHVYIHDVNSEGMYIGSTGADPQHMLNHLRIENCYVARVGCEAIQLSQLGEGCVVQNNVFWGSFDWLSPFFRWQDHVAQLMPRNGGTIFKNNILIGSAAAFFNIINKPRADITPNGDSIVILNNVNWGARGPIGAFQNAQTDSVTGVVWRGNYWGDFRYDYDIVYTSSPDSEDIIRIAARDISVTVADNIYDSTNTNMTKLWAGSNAQVNESGSSQTTINKPSFRNIVGSAYDDGDFLKWNRWTATVGEDARFPSSQTNKGDTVFFSVGDIVQHNEDGLTKFYRCIQANGAVEPLGNGNAYWELITWDNNGKESYLPPDDARLIVGSEFHNLGIGLVENAPVFRRRMPSNSSVVENPIEDNTNEHFYIKSAYPNPFSDQLTFQIHPKLENIHITAIDIWGNKRQLPVKFSSGRIVSKTHSLRKGFYIVIIEGEYVQNDKRYATISKQTIQKQ